MIGRVRYRLVGALILLVVALATTPGASADQVFHSERIVLTTVAGAPLRSGFVVDIRPNGPIVYELERYVLIGAAPDTRYDVQFEVFINNPSCAGSPDFGFLDTTLQTDRFGNTEALVTIPPSAIPPGARGTTFGGVWQVLTGGMVAYQTACVPTTLD
jgi:hypothetical protein